jgi:aryl-alcohol dehydrogenase-like predicted oxidoreductase
MRTRPLGKTGIQVSEIGFGTWPIGGPSFHSGNPTGFGKNLDDRSALLTLRLAIDQGYTFFDTSPLYGSGRSEELLGQLDSRKELVICTKYGVRYGEDGSKIQDYSKAELEQSVTSSLKRLKRDTIDVLLLHSPPNDFDWGKFDFAPLDSLKSRGIIRAYGISAHGNQGAQRFLEAVKSSAHVIEVLYHCLNRSAEKQVLGLAEQADCGLIVRVPLASGFLTPAGLESCLTASSDDYRSKYSPAELQWRYDAVAKLKFLNDLPGGIATSALRFCLSRQNVSSVIPGITSLSHVAASRQASELGPLSPDILRQIEAVIPEPYAFWPP